LITAKPKRNIVRLIITITILAAILGGITTVVLFETRSAASSGPDFSITLLKGTIENPGGTNLGSTETILNGTSGLNNSGEKIIVTVNRNGTFSSFVRLNVTGLPPGITYSFLPIVVRPVSGAASTTLTLSAADNVVVRAAPYNVTVVGTSESPRIVHSASFHLLVRNTKMFLKPSVQTVLKGQSVTVSLELSGAYNITGFQFSLSYNSTLLTGLTNGLAFNPDFTNFGFIVPPTATCPWVDNSTGTIGPCGVAAAFLGQCSTTACITVTGSQFYNLVNVTFMANLSGTATLTLKSTILTEAEGVNISTPPHHTGDSIITIGEAYYPGGSISDGGSETMLWLPGLVMFAPVLPLVFYYRLRRVRTVVRTSDASRQPRYNA
jgi:hypothetical protein